MRQRRRRKKAFETLNAFAKRNPKNVSRWLRRAEFLRGRGYLNEAIDSVRQTVDLTAENFEARLLLIDLETDAGNFAEVETRVEATEAIAEARGDASCFRLKLRKNAGET